MKRNPASPEKERAMQEAVRLYTQGGAMGESARLAGVSQAGLSRRLKRDGLRRPSHSVADKLDIATRLVDEGLTQTEAARKTGVTRSSLSKRLHGSVPAVHRAVQIVVDEGIDERDAAKRVGLEFQLVHRALGSYRNFPGETIAHQRISRAGYLDARAQILLDRANVVQSHAGRIQAEAAKLQEEAARERAAAGTASKGRALRRARKTENVDNPPARQRSMARRKPPTSRLTANPEEEGGRYIGVWHTHEDEMGYGYRHCSVIQGPDDEAVQEQMIQVIEDGEAPFWPGWVSTSDHIDTGAVEGDGTGKFWYVSWVEPDEEKEADDEGREPNSSSIAVTLGDQRTFKSRADAEKWLESTGQCPYGDPVYVPYPYPEDIPGKVKERRSIARRKSPKKGGPGGAALIRKFLRGLP